MSRRILVTGIGGNVGQGVVRSVRAFDPSIVIVGTNTERVSGGNHLCDVVHEVPYAYAEGYEARLGSICVDERVELIIPSTDYETYFLAGAAPRLPPVVVSPPATCDVFLDKLHTWEHFSAHGIPFAESCRPSQYAGGFSTLIAKPRKGRGSRGILIDPPSPTSLGDDYLLQRRHEGDEITTAFYVRRDGRLHGAITLRRSLASGMTSACEVVTDLDAPIFSLIEKLMASLTIVGSCNVQSIVTADGQIIPFEVNGRLSGTNSIRGRLGFEDVRYTIEEHLLGIAPTPVNVRRGAAVRMMVDVIYPDMSLSDIQDRHDTFEIF